MNVNPATNRITTSGYGYDDNGNLTAMPLMTMSCNVDNRLIEAMRTGMGTDQYVTTRAASGYGRRSAGVPESVARGNWSTSTGWRAICCWRDPRNAESGSVDVIADALATSLVSKNYLYAWASSLSPTSAQAADLLRGPGWGFTGGANVGGEAVGNFQGGWLGGPIVGSPTVQVGAGWTWVFRP